MYHCTFASNAGHGTVSSPEISFKEALNQRQQKGSVYSQTAYIKRILVTNTHGTHTRTPTIYSHFVLTLTPLTLAPPP